MALWSNKTVQVPGLASVYASSGPISAQSRYHYILDTTLNTITVNLPIGIDGTTIRISDAKGTFLTNNVTVNPASGQKINNLATNEPLILDANEMWIEFTWNASAGSWIINAPGILALITDTYTDYPYITSPSSPATSTLRLYAKSDGKLYIKNSAGIESKVGGGLEHPTSGSTFEVDSYNISMTGQYNTGIGYLAGVSITSGSENTVLGLSAGQQITTGGSNTLIGSGAGLYISANGSNTAVGRNSFRSYGTVSNSTAIGSGAGFYAQGSGHTLIGSNADSYTDSGSYNNTAIGKETGIQTSSTGVSGTVCIGIDSSGNAAVATSSNQFVLGAINHKYRFPGIAETALVLGPTGTSTGNTGELRFRELAANGTNYISLKAPDAITSNIAWVLPSTDGTNGQALITNGSGTLSWAAAGNTIISITQASHGFLAADIGRPLYLNGSTYTYAKADLDATAEVAGLIYSIIDTNTFQICVGGEVGSVGANLVEGGGSLTAGTVYFLSATTAGKITTTPSAVIGHITKPIGVARSTTAFDFFNMRGSVVGGTNAQSQVSLTNNSVTTVQNVGSYDAGELTGWIYIDATTDYRFYIEAKFVKTAASTYELAFNTVGDVPPSGFNFSVTSAGLIQATLPSVAGFIAAKINFSLNAPAIGATFPLQIDSTNVSFNTIQAKDASGIVFKENNGTTTVVIDDFGNVGIGVTSPSKKLDIDATNSSITTTSGISVINQSTTADTRAGIAFKNYDNWSSSIWSPRTGSSAGALVFGTNSGTGTAETNIAERMRIDSAGRLDFGVLNSTPPTYKGKIRLPVSSRTTDGGIEFLAAASSNGYGFRIINPDDLSGVTPLIFQGRASSTSWSDLFRIDTDGTVRTSTLVSQSAGANTLYGAYNVSEVTLGDGYYGTALHWQSLIPSGYRQHASIGSWRSGAWGTVFIGVGGNDNAISSLYHFSYTGAAYQANNSTTWSTTSDERIKQNIRPVNNSLSKIISLNPVHFEYIDKAGKTKTGFIAQEFESILPGHVHESGCPESIFNIKPELKNEKIKSIDSDLIPYLVGAIKELKLELDEAKKELEVLKKN